MHSLIHELQVHQIELEMQNEELRRIQNEIEDSRTKYSDLYDEYSNLYDFAPVGYFTIKEKGIIEQANLTGATLLGLDRQSLIGKPLNRFISREDQDTFYLHHVQVLKKNGNHTCEIRMMNYDNAPFYAQLESMAVRGEDKNPAKLRTAITDITDRKLADEQLQASLKEKEVLLQEIHHRVKNNMQVMISLINLQCETIEDKYICDVFNKTVDRINSMALVHNQLYKSKDFAKVDINKYLISIVENLFVSLGVDTAKISLKIGKNNIALSLDSAISCGLIINELITNSIKHAFPDGRQGQISVEFRFIENNDIEMMLADDGVGMPVNMDCRDNNTLGLQVVIGLAEHQLGGSLNIDRTNGTKFIIRFQDTPQKGFPQK
jgi:PAS domain S-box-containing protein